MTRQIAVIGECMVELRRAGQGLLAQGFGGDTLNTALYLARLGNQALAVHYVTALGQDGFSSQMLAAWQQEGIHTDWVQRLADKAPGLYLIDTAADGERSFTYWRSDAAARYWLVQPEGEDILAALGQCDLVYVSGISLAILPPASRQRLLEGLAAARARGARIAFDNNYRPRLWQDKETAKEAYTAILRLADIALLTLDDEQALWGDAEVETCLARSQGFGVGEIVVKRGSEPCLVVTAAQRIEIAALRLSAEQVIDTTAAGDSFSAGYLAARLQGPTSPTPPGQATAWRRPSSSIRGPSFPPPTCHHSRKRTMSDLIARLEALKVIPVIALKDAAQAVPLARVLVENGLPAAEVTFRTPAAAEAIRQMRAAYPDLLIGAGTVLNREQVDAAVAAGADFIVSPGFNPTTVQYCLDKDVTIIPGVNNPSLVEQAMEMGLRHLKFFPAEQSGGTAMLKALGAVYPVRFMPTGGVTPANLKEYLGLNAVIACGGTWMVPAKLIDEGRWEELAALVREAVAAL
ncbi:bifunctional 4-hydroxy-2-oxoglutarate aldolase/2-dehydro-3-deoxy-phosphogluconate aldolase [Aeromonas caviae]